MKIGIYDPYLDTLGGGEKYMLTIAECLSQDHEVSVFWDHESDLKRVTQRFSLDLSHVKRVDNIFRTSYSSRKRLSESNKYDVVIYLSDGSIPIVRCKLYIHFQFPIEWVSLKPFTRIKLRRVEKIFCNSEFTKQFVDKKLKKESTVVYPPVDMYPLSEMKKENTILHVGRFMGNGVEGDDYKKQQFMVSAFMKLVDAGLSDWKLIIASGVRDSEKETFIEFQQNCKGYPIEFVVNSTNQELWHLYQKSKIYWHASGYGENLTKHPERAEHFGITTVEAMHGGVVPVVINAGGQKEIVRDNTNGLLWKTEEELISSTKKLIEDSSLLSTLSEHAQQSAELYSKEMFYQNIRSLIEA